MEQEDSCKFPYDGKIFSHCWVHDHIEYVIILKHFSTRFDLPCCLFPKIYCTFCKWVIQS